ncbi:hypothetical protein FOZ62_016186, partial [Perkinsus olseni]
KDQSEGVPAEEEPSSDETGDQMGRAHLIIELIAWSTGSSPGRRAHRLVDGLIAWSTGSSPGRRAHRLVDGFIAWSTGSSPGGMVLLEPGSFGDYQETKLKYQGYCPIAIVDGGGLLIPGDPQHGLLRLEGEVVSLVACSSRTAVRRFMADRAGYEEGVKAYCRLLPPLIPLL